MPRLVITKGAAVGRDHAIGLECVIGRSPDVDFPVEDNLASRRHVRVYVDGDGYSLEDLGSRNGTVVNWRRIVRCSLVDGDAIVVGATVFLFTQKSILPEEVAARSAASAAASASAPALSETMTIKVPPAVARPPVVPTAPVRPAMAARPAIPAKPAAVVPPAAPASPAKAAPAPLVIKRRRPMS